MIHQFWTYLLYLYWSLQNSISRCPGPTPLVIPGPHGEEFPRTYLGYWHFIAGSAPTPDPLATFDPVDNILFHLVPGSTPLELYLRASIRMKNGLCVPREWTYLLAKGTTNLRIEGRPNMKTELFSAPCAESIILKETGQDYERFLMYSRSPAPPARCVNDFQALVSCWNFTLLQTPRQQDACMLTSS
ncbi:apolipoprotein M [Ornithorhynchus anatinus]|uniref:Apolipoprotein M n=1 Tax=Ornithorhynchus anatinus TaxID=9258 RepID=A7X5R2_ORNAN|nr:apolipoprotein M [Ornithorhynchus anatinus]ABU86907.1 Apom [Ornithorhynchus anatinus]